MYIRRLFLIACLGALSLFTIAQDAYVPQSAYDCTMVNTDDVDASQLTIIERIALEELAFFASIEGYSSCMGQVQAQAAKEIGAGAGGGSGSGAGESEGENGADGDEAASDGLAADTHKAMASRPPRGDSRRNGAKDKVLAPKDNDSIVCQILHEEINNENNRQKKADLQKEYRKYNCG